MKMPVKVETNAEKSVIVGAAAFILAVIFDQKNLCMDHFRRQKKKKPEKRKSLFQRVSKHYKRIDKLASKTIAKNVAANEAKRRENMGIKSPKLRKITLEDSIPFDLELEEKTDD